MIGLVFSDEKDAKTLHKKLTSRKATKAKSTHSTKTVSKGGKIDKSMISGPVGGSFKHVAHMEFDMEKGFITEGVDQSWGQLAAELHKDYGIPKALVEANTDFIRGFFETAKRNGRIEATQEPPKKKPPPPPVPRRGTHGPSASVTSTNGDAEPTAVTPASPARVPHARPIPPPQPPPRSAPPAPPPQRNSSTPAPPPLPFRSPAQPPPPPPARPASTAPVHPSRPAPPRSGVTPTPPDNGPPQPPPPPPTSGPSPSRPPPPINGPPPRPPPSINGPPPPPPDRKSVV